MKSLPQNLLHSLQEVKGFDREAFEKLHASGEQVTSVRINPGKVSGANEEMLSDQIFSHSSASHPQKIPWAGHGYYLHARPSFTFDPLFHAGCYYVQDASSMFLEQALTQTTDLTQPLTVLDLCAAPGGKSTHLQSLLSAQSLLVSNEVIKARAGVLKQNIIKWGSNNVVVSNNDPQHFARLQGFFDVLVVDAPCSGSGLFRKDEKAMEEWSPQGVELCSGRQRRILSDALPSLKEGGVLIYSTCSYSAAEDEEIADWLVKEEEMESIKLALQDDWNIIETAAPSRNAAGYRFYPDKLKGEGFYLACFRKKKSTSSTNFKKTRTEKLTATEKDILKNWVKEDGLIFLKHNGRILALPEHLQEPFSILQAALYIQYAGTDIGEIMHHKLIPDHALALSTILSEKKSRTELDYETAIRFLQRQDIESPALKGWQVVTFSGYPLGWINALGNRVNNYYPKGLRILKQRPDSDF